MLRDHVNFNRGFSNYWKPSWANDVKQWYCHLTYSQTSRKRPPKMRRVRGRLWEVVSYESQTAGGLSQEEVLTHLPFEENVLHAILIHVVLQNDRSVQYMSTDSR